MRSAPPGEPTRSPTPEAEDNDLLRSTLSSVLLACDIVFGTTVTGLALLSVWFLALGSSRTPMPRRWGAPT